MFVFVIFSRNVSAFRVPQDLKRSFRYAGNVRARVNERDRDLHFRRPTARNRETINRRGDARMARVTSERRNRCVTWRSRASYSLRSVRADDYPSRRVSASDNRRDYASTALVDTPDASETIPRSASHTATSVSPAGQLRGAARGVSLR